MRYAGSIMSNAGSRMRYAGSIMSNPVSRLKDVSCSLKEE
jgi:hypothetical protein